MDLSPITTTPAQVKLEGSAWTNFIGAIRSPESRETYGSKVGLFGRYCQQFRRIETADDLLVETKEVERWIIQWLTELKNQGRAFNTIWNARNALKKFYSCNDLELRWKKIGQYLPEADIAVEDRSYTRDEIAKLLG
ncbi:MAG TPA: hypothetical protein VGQ13_06420, partial [Nitrososphaera sp.]|nr:hypothetical protein [Nitrososphaera sp.]